MAWCWQQVDWEQGFVTLQAEEIKSGYARDVPILSGDMTQMAQGRTGSQTSATGYLPRTEYLEGFAKHLPRGRSVTAFRWCSLI